MLTIISIFLVYSGYQQKKISDEQVEKFRNEIKKAEKISTELKASNETILEYNLAIMSREGYVGGTGWRRRAKLYLVGKEMAKKYYAKSDSMAEILKHARHGVLYGFSRELGHIVDWDVNDGHTLIGDLDISKQMADAFTVSKRDSANAFNEYLNYDYDKLFEVGEQLTSSAAKTTWYKELNDLDKFWKTNKLS